MLEVPAPIAENSSQNTAGETTLRDAYSLNSAQKGSIGDTVAHGWSGHTGQMNSNTALTQTSANLTFIQERTSSGTPDPSESNGPLCIFQPCNFRRKKCTGTYWNHCQTAHPELFRCQECGMRFNEPVEILTHKGSGHRAIRCRVDGCEATYWDWTYYAKHLYNHKMRYPCKYCSNHFDDSAFFSKCDRTLHVLRAHPDKVMEIDIDKDI